jgi:hypothetical protein
MRAAGSKTKNSSSANFCFSTDQGWFFCFVEGPSILCRSSKIGSSNFCGKIFILGKALSERRAYQKCRSEHWAANSGGPFLF